MERFDSYVIPKSLKKPITPKNKGKANNMRAIRMSRQNPRMTAVLILYFEFLQDMASRHPAPLFSLFYHVLEIKGESRVIDCLPHLHNSADKRRIDVNRALSTIDHAF